MFDRLHNLTPEQRKALHKGLAFAALTAWVLEHAFPIVGEGLAIGVTLVWLGE